METFFTTETVHGIKVIRLAFNEISLEQRKELKEQFLEVISGEGKNFIIDFTKVGFVSSLVIATIIFFSKEIGKKGGSVKLSGLSGESRGIFQITQLDKVFELYDTVQDALESF